jgi:crotonobetainyl-CoA:carnitine CoA-transferase CaiB-like acyl-CoA transferase
MNQRLPIQGMRVLDFTRVLAGPFATMILGDLGAEVIKVEPPQGDESRTWPPVLPRGESGYYMILNRNKRSITLNLKNARAREIAVNLAAQADVVVENFTPGVTKKLGIDYNTIAVKNPDIIYCSVSGFGQTGPYKNKKAYDPIIQGMTGLMSITGERNRSPVKVGIPITDLVAAIQSVNAIMAAYIHRLQTGEGQFIDVSLFDSMLSLLTIMAMDYFATGKPPERWGMDHIHRVPARAFPTKDGRYVQVAATSDTMYPDFCRVLGLEHLITDPRFQTNSKRLENRDIIMPILEARMMENDSTEWLSLFEAAGIPCGPILNMKEVFQDPHVVFRDMLFTMDHPTEGSVPQLGFPYKFSNTPLKARKSPPQLGEDTEAVLCEWLKMKREEVDELRKAGAI